MEFIKRHLFLIITFSVMMLVTIGALMVIKTRVADGKQYEEAVERIFQAERSFSTSEYALTVDNVAKAEANYTLAKERFDSLIAELREKFSVPQVNSDMSPLKFKQHLRQNFCIKMENLLRGEDVWIPDGLKYFSYDGYMRPDVLPSAEEINAILKQLEIVQEIIYLISQSQLKQFTAFQRLNDIKTVDRDLYNFMPFSITVVGNIKAVQTLLNSFHDARFFLMVRTLDLRISEPKRNRPPAKDPSQAGKMLPKNKRLVYTNEPPDMTATIVLDYFEFHDKE